MKISHFFISTIALLPLIATSGIWSMQQETLVAGAGASTATDTDAAQTNSPVDQISDDVLGEIFQHLDQLQDHRNTRLVCHRWRRVHTNTPITRLDLNGHCDLYDEDLQFLPTVCPQITHINLHGCREFTDVGVQALVAACTGLIQVDLNFTKITDASILAIARMSKHAVEMGDPGIMEINLTSCNAVTDLGIKALAEACPNLTHVYLDNCPITDAGIKALAEKCHKITEIGVHNCKKTNQGIQAIAEHCPRLTRIYLGSNLEISDPSIQALTSHCPGIVDIDISRTGISDEGLKSIAEHYKKLKHIEAEMCVDITDEGLQALATGCPDLTCINLNYDLGFTDTGISALAEMSKRAIAAEHTGITNLDLDDCQRLTDSALRALADGCPNLTTIHFARAGKTFFGWDPVTDQGLSYLTQHCHNIRRISLGDNVSDQIIQQIAQDLPELEAISFSSDGSITDASIEALISHCPHLRDVVCYDLCTHNPNVSKTAVEKLRALCRHNSTRTPR